MKCKDCVHYIVCVEMWEKENCGAFNDYEKTFNGCISYRIDEPYWHTGEPTEEGLYTCYVKFNIENYYTVSKYDLCQFADLGHGWVSTGGNRVIAWHKIPDYEEQK